MLQDIETVMSWLLDYKRTHPNFKFKDRTTPVNNLQQSYWLNGNPSYCFVKFSNRGVPNRFTTISYRFWYRRNQIHNFDFFISYNKELDNNNQQNNLIIRDENSRLINCIRFLDNNLARFNISNYQNYNNDTWGGKSYRFALNNQAILPQAIQKLEYFIEYIKPELDKILNTNLTNDTVRDYLFISDDTFLEYIDLLNQYRPGSKRQAGMI